VIYDPVMIRIVMVLALAGLPVVAHAAEPPALARARALYNAGSYDAAIDAAASVRRDPTAGDSAALVLARAHLERFRVGAASDDLTAAREALVAIRPARLSARDQLDLLVGLGQTLYLSQTFGAAADVFDTALGRAAILTPPDRARLLDWWATALDREAQTRPAERRAPIFASLAGRMQEELRADPGSAIANYWLVAATRGSGDLDGAWDAAIAGWVRATLGPDPAGLRMELDRLVGEALIPERARALSAGDLPDAAFALRAEWEQVKESWK